MNYETLLKELKNSIVTITFTHYRTGVQETVRGTLNTGKPVVSQHPDCEFIVFWDIDKENWKSLDKKTIVSYE